MVSRLPHIALREPQRGNDRHDQYSTEKITDAVDTVEGKSGNDPRGHLLEAQAVQESLCGRVECSVQKAVRGADEHVHYRLYPFWNVHGKEHDSAPQDSPQVQIRYPPCRKAVEDTGHEDIDIDGIQRFFPVYHCEGDRKDADQVDIGCKFHDELGGVHDGAEHGKDDDLPGCGFHAYSALKA